MAKFTKIDFLKNMKNDTLKNFTVLNNLASSNDKKRYAILNKNENEILLFSKPALALKLTNLLQEKYKLKSSIITEQDIDQNVKTVDVITEDLGKAVGAAYKNDISYYNYLIETEMEKEFKSIINGKKVKYEYNFNFDMYPHINYLIDHLLNIDYISNKSNNVDIKRHFLNWNAFCLQYKQKSGMAYVFISSTHGTGKGVYSSILESFFTTLYLAEINNDTLTQQFNGLMNNKRFLIFNESEIDRRDYEKVSSKLKSLIADEVLTVRKMRTDQYNTSSYFNMLINSNSKVPFKIENSDRRFCVLHNSIRSLKTAVKEDLDMDIQDFVNKVNNEKYSYLQDLVRLEVDLKMARHNSFTNDAKKHIIKNTNTQMNNLIKLIENNETEGLIEYFYDVAESDGFERFMEEVDGGFLTNETVNGFLSDNFNEEDISKMNKKNFWDKKLGESKKINYKSTSGLNKQARVRTLANFDVEKMSKYLSKNEIPFIEEEDTKTLKDIKIEKIKSKYIKKEEKEFKAVILEGDKPFCLEDLNEESDSFEKEMGFNNKEEDDYVLDFEEISKEDLESLFPDFS